MFGNIGGWPLNIGLNSLEFGLGGMSKKLKVGMVQLKSANISASLDV
jgi:hypothetical protein